MKIRKSAEIQLRWNVTNTVVTKISVKHVRNGDWSEDRVLPEITRDQEILQSSQNSLSSQST